MPGQQQISLVSIDFQQLVLHLCRLNLYVLLDAILNEAIRQMSTGCDDHQ